MKSVCGIADVIRDRQNMYKEDLPYMPLKDQPIHYSHMIDLDTIEPRSEQELQVEMFILDTLICDYDHYVNKERYRYTPYKNSVFHNNRYYTFDFNNAFDPHGVFQDKTTEGTLLNDISEKFELWFDKDSAAIQLLREKIIFLRKLYEGEEGYALFLAQLKEAGISNDLKELFWGVPVKGWDKPVEEFYHFFLFRINVLETFLET